MATRARAGDSGRIYVVFVHGLFAEPATWAAFEKLIAHDEDLSGKVITHCFRYNSPVFRLRPDRQIAEVDDVADQLATELGVLLGEDDSAVLVSHSQGGLIVQRYLARTLAGGEGPSLTPVKSIVMFACPNNGSPFLLVLRQLMVFWRHNQERQLRLSPRAVVETQRTILRAVVNADSRTASTWPIPVYAYGGSTDNVVRPDNARGNFPAGGVVDGNHSSLVRPTGTQHASYQVVKAEIVKAIRLREAPHGDGEQSAVSRPDRDHTAPASGPSHPLSPHSVNPRHGLRRGRLYGRTRNNIITRIMTAGPETPVHVLTGLGGSGKTRIALEVAERAEKAGRRVWWVSVTQINASMREVANRLGIPPGQVEQAFRGDGSPTDLVWEWLERADYPWLIVFDNADDPQRLGPLDGHVSDGTGWLRTPSRPNGLVVVTSRDRDAHTWAARSARYPVSPLDRDEGAALLMEWVDGGGTVEQARRLSDVLGGLPLALRGAAALLASVRGAEVSLRDSAITDFESYRAAVRARMASPPGTTSSGLDESLGLAIMAEVCGIALQLLADRGLPEAAPLLKAFACLSTAPIPYRLLLKSCVFDESPLFTDFSLAQREAVLKGLVGLGQVDTAHTEGVARPDLAHVLSLHPVVHGLLRGDEAVQNGRSDYYGLNVNVLLDIVRDAPPDLPESWPVWALIAPHAIEVAGASLVGSDRLDDAGVVTAALELARLTARYLIVVGLLRPAHELVRRVVSRCEEYGYRYDDLEVLALRHEGGRIALEAGEPGRAERELREIVAAREQLLGPQHAATLASRHKLAKAVLELRRWAEAEPMLRSIVRAENTVNDPEHSDTIAVRHSWARAALALGRLKEAEAELRAILEVSLRKWSPATKETLHIRQTLTRTLLETARTDDAEAEIKEALRDAAQGPDSPLAMSLRFTYCKVLLMQGRIEETDAELVRLLEDRTRELGAEHRETLRTRRFLERTRGIPGPPVENE